jgi:hypothetical protein
MWGHGVMSEQQIPFGNDNKKSKGEDKSCLQLISFRASSGGEEVGVDGHAGYYVYVDLGKGVDFGLGADAAGYD